MEQRETKKPIRTFAFVSFLNDLGSDMICPVWPLFVTTFLGVNMAVLGFIDGLGEALVSLSQAVSGYISDRIGKRKIFIWTGYFFGVKSSKVSILADKRKWRKVTAQMHLYSPSQLSKEWGEVLTSVQTI
jgi:hypothetical protein